MLLFSFILLFNDFCQTYYLNIYRTDLYRICRNGRTMVADEKSEVKSFFTDLSRDVAMGKVCRQNRPPIHTFIVRSHDIRWAYEKKRN